MPEGPQQWQQLASRIRLGARVRPLHTQGAPRRAPAMRERCSKPQGALSESECEDDGGETDASEEAEDD